MKNAVKLFFVISEIILPLIAYKFHWNKKHRLSHVRMESLFILKNISICETQSASKHNWILCYPQQQVSCGNKTIRLPMPLVQKRYNIHLCVDPAFPYIFSSFFLVFVQNQLHSTIKVTVVNYSVGKSVWCSG